MKKTMLTALTAVLMAVILTACMGLAPQRQDENGAIFNAEAASNGQADYALEPDDQPVEVWRGGPVRGTWHDETYVNEYLNLRFMMPIGWVTATDEEIAELVGLTVEMLDGQGPNLPDEFWESVGTNEIIDMMAIDPFSGTNVQVIYERLVFPHRRISEAEYIRILTNNLIEIGMRVHSVPGTVQIGDYTWHSIRTEMYVFDTLMSGRQFINIRDGFVRTLVFSFGAEIDPVDMLLTRFSSLDEPPPPPPGHDEALIGTWAWDADHSYIYVFEADGHGMRGFYPDLDPFSWLTSGTDELILHFGFWQETWIYTIEGDMVTLDSVDFPGDIFSYIRWSGDFIPAETMPRDIDFTGHPLVGIWEWDGDPNWIYIFNPDGTGARGMPDNRQTFYWYANDDQLLTGFELWTFTIQDNVLILEAPGIVYSYIRAADIGETIGDSPMAATA